MTDPSHPRGTGPGVITPDGCAVDFYARITAMGEPGIVHDADGYLTDDHAWLRTIPERRP